MSGPVEFTLNEGPVFNRLKAAKARGPQAIAREIYRLNNEIMTDAKQNYVPVEEVGPAGGIKGLLRASGTVEKPIIHGDGSVSCRMFFGGAASAYALAVHEHLSEYSPPSWQKAEASGRGVHFHPDGHGPKYLERPVAAHTRDVPVAAASAFRGMFDGSDVGGSELTSPSAGDDMAGFKRR